MARMINRLGSVPPVRMNPPINTLSPVSASPRVEMFSGLLSTGVGVGEADGLGDTLGLGETVGEGETVGLGDGETVGLGLAVGLGVGVGLGDGPAKTSAVSLTNGRPTPPAIKILPSFNSVAV